MSDIRKPSYDNLELNSYPTRLLQQYILADLDLVIYKRNSSDYIMLAVVLFLGFESGVI